MSVRQDNKTKSVKTVVTVEPALAALVETRARQKFSKPPKYYKDLAVADLIQAGMIAPGGTGGKS